MDDIEPTTDGERLDSARVHRALGIFLLAFGLLVLVAAIFTETTEGRITNLVAGGILALIGGGMAKPPRRRPRDRPD